MGYVPKARTIDMFIVGGIMISRPGVRIGLGFVPLCQRRPGQRLRGRRADLNCRTGTDRRSVTKLRHQGRSDSGRNAQHHGLANRQGYRFFALRPSSGRERRIEYVRRLALSRAQLCSLFSCLSCVSLVVRPHMETRARRPTATGLVVIRSTLLSVTATNSKSKELCEKGI